MFTYDAFLSHNSKDKPAVESLAIRLEDEAGLKVFLDKWNLVPGDPWQEELEQAMGQSHTVVVFLGPSGIGGWHNEEMRNALNRRVQDPEMRVIPVLLPNTKAKEDYNLPAFLTRLTWVDFRNGFDDGEAFLRLVAGIRGEAPGRRKSTIHEEDTIALQSTAKEPPQLQQIRQFIPIPLLPGFGNSYLKNLYIDFPQGDEELGRIIFHFPADAIIFDTYEQIRYGTRRKDGNLEIELRLPEPTTNLKSVHILINSGNSKGLYFSEEIGEIILVFEDAPPIATPLILGTNIREWCLGNPGDFVRTTSDSFSSNAWKGISTSGANAVMDCLQIPVHDILRSATLEKIVFVHKPTQHLEDTLGVHFLVFAVSLELDLDRKQISQH